MSLIRLIAVAVAVFICSTAGEALASLRAPLQGAELKTALSPAQQQRASYFRAIKIQLLEGGSEDAQEAIRKVEMINKSVHTILDIAEFFGDIGDYADSGTEMYFQTQRIAQAANIITYGISGPRLKTYLQKRETSDRNARAFLLAGIFMKLAMQEFPIIMEDSLFKQYAEALEQNDIDNLVTKFNQLLDHPNPAVNWFVHASVDVSIKLVENLPEAYTVGKDLVALVRTAGFWKAVKAAGVSIKTAMTAEEKVSPATFALDAVSIALDLGSAKTVSAVSADLKTKMIALEFLDYYLVTYGGDLSAFKADLGVSAARPTIDELFAAFTEQKTVFGGTMKETYGAVDWLDTIFRNTYDATEAVALIRRILTNAGPLTMRIGYDGTATALVWGRNVAFRVDLDPLVANEYTLSGGATCAQTGGPTATVSSGGTFTPDSGTPGEKSFHVSYTLQKGGTSGAHQFDFSDTVLIDSSIVKAPQLSFENLSVSGSGRAMNLGLSLGLAQLTLPYGTSGATLPVTSDTRITARLAYTSSSGSVLYTPWVQVPANLTSKAAVTVPLASPAAVAVKAGNIGTYSVEVQVAHPQVFGLVKGATAWTPKYDDLTASTTPPTTPYLEIQAPAAVRALSLNNTLRLTPSDKIRLYPRNDAGWPDFKGLTGTISVLLHDLNNKSYAVPGTLLTDGGVEFSITAGMPSDSYYSVVTIFDNQQHLAPGYAVQQVVETSSSTGGSGTGGGGSSGTLTIPRTGQYTCYNTSGTVIPCAGTGQDGAIQAGAPWPEPRFINNNDGTITDRLTNLVWLKKANCYDDSKNWYSALVAVKMLASGYCGLSDGSITGDWRLPNRNEIWSLINRGVPDNRIWLSNYGFSGLTSIGKFWTSSMSGLNDAWIIDLAQGRTSTDSKVDTGIFAERYRWNFIIAVRDSKEGNSTVPATGISTCTTSSCTVGGGCSNIVTGCQNSGQDGEFQKGIAIGSSERFAVGSGTITDNLTGLVWSQNANLAGTKKSWDLALTEVAAMNNGSKLNYGYTDWRLPNINELASLVNLGVANNADWLTSNNFINVQGTDGYWSSSVGWFLNLKKGGSLDADTIDNLHFIWPVRGGQVGTATNSVSVTFLSENLPDGRYQVGSTTKTWRFKNGANAITGLKAVRVSADSGLGITQTEIAIGDIAANTEFLVNLPINPVHDYTNLKSSYWKLVDGTGADVTITNSATNQFWLKIRTNRPPVFSQLQLDSVAGQAGSAVSLPILASDPDNDNLTYSVVSGGGSIASGTWQGRAAKLYQNTFTTAGIHPVTIKVDDGHGDSAQYTIQAVITPDGKINRFFTDVPYPADPANNRQQYDQYLAIHYLTLNGITIGRPDPNDSSSRIFEGNNIAKQAEALGMVMKAAALRGILDLDADPRDLPNLIKVDAPNGIYENFSWVAPYLLKAEELGMIDSADTFDPSAPATREWLATLVTRMMDLETPMDVITNPANYAFADVGSFTGTDAYDAARSVAFFGYVGQLGSTALFNPRDSMIRADVAVVASKILRSPSTEGITTSGLTQQTLYGRELPVLTHGQSFTVTGAVNLSARRMLDTGGSIIEDWLFPPADYTKAYIIRPGYGVVATTLIKDLATAPVSVTTAIPDIAASEVRSLVVLLEATDPDGNNPVRGMYRMDYGVVFPDADGDGVRDDLDQWPNNPLYAKSTSGNGIPDNANALWSLTGRSSADTVFINGVNLKLIDAVLLGNIGNDTTPPTTTASVPAGTYTSAQSVTLSANETATIYYTVDGSTPTTASAKYSSPVNITASAILQFFAVDLAGNAESPKNAFYTISGTPPPVDMAGPMLHLSTLSNNAVTNNATLNVTGSAADVSGIKQLTVNGVNVSIDGTGNFSCAITLQPGSNTITTTATDNAGNQTTDTRTIILDQTAPLLTVSTPADNSKTAASFSTVSGSIDKTSTVNVTVNSDSPQSAAITDSSFSATVNLGAGINTIDITATDLAGNRSSAKRTVTYDNRKPSLAITSPAQDVTIETSSLILQGTVGDAIGSVTVNITIDGQAFTPVVNNGAFQQQLNFSAQKQYAITVTTTDAAGNTATVQRNVIYQPAVQSPKGDVNNDGKIDIMDALLTLQYALNLIPHNSTNDPVYQAASDVAPLDTGMKPKGDGKVDVMDALVILQRAVNLLSW